MKLVTIVGARPQFIKAAVVTRAIEQYNVQANDDSSVIRELIIHTGQHFDANMSDIFFEELEIPKPDYNLGIDSATHGAMTGRMLEAIETILISEDPDVVIVYGDTNSTLAGALAAAKLHIPVAHVEAGLRSFNMRMPEEINRIVADRVSTVLFCPTETAVENLRNEGFVNIMNNGQLLKTSDCSHLSPRPTPLVANIGDVMYEAALFYAARAAEKSDIMDILGIEPGEYVLCTIHRAENTDVPKRLGDIVHALGEIARHTNVILPLHPRTKKVLAPGTVSMENITVIEPVSYFDMIILEKHCSAVLTDSGGVQKEAYFFQKPCVTLRDETEWVELVKEGVNFVVGADTEKILKTFNDLPDKTLDFSKQLYGENNVGEKIVSVLSRLLTVPYK